MTDDLSPRHRAFVDAYLVNGYNAAAAYRQTYTTCKRSTAETNGPRLLRTAQVRAALADAMEAASMDAAELLHRLAQIARNPVTDYLRGDGSLDLEGVLAGGLGHLVKTTRRDGAGRLVVRWLDAQRALALLVRIHERAGSFATARPSGDVSAPDLSPDRIAQVRDQLIERVRRLAAEDRSPDAVPPTPDRTVGLARR